MRFFRGTAMDSVPLSLWALLSMSLLPLDSVAAAADKTAADYFVHSLPGAPDGPLLKMHAGHIEIKPESSTPGCSSLDGALMELGPYRVKDGGDSPKLEYNPGAWDEFANVIFVDNPVGTGFSFVDTNAYVHELPEMADQFVIFLEKFFAIFPEFEHDDLYIAGESYAGQHIPYITKAILDRNKKEGRRATWQIRKILIGNGWISPAEQYPSYLKFAYEKGLVKRDSEMAKRLESRQAICMRFLNEQGGKDHVDSGECEDVLQSILRETLVTDSKGQSQCTNMYDVRLTDSYPSCGMNWPSDLKQVTPYLRRHDVIAALHVDPGKRTGWRECDGGVGNAFRASKSKPSIQILPEIIKEVPIVLFSGAEDLICNHIGTEELISNMEWNGGKGFELSPGTWAPRRNWEFEGEAAGFWQEARNLTYVLFNNSSHMVPFDHSRRTRDMLDRVMGVDIGSIGGVPTDSRIDGEKGLETSVGGHPNSTTAQASQQEKLNAAKWHAYYKSGEVVLVIVIIAAAAWGYYIWRERRQRDGYKGLFGGEPLSLGGAGARVRGYRDALRNRRSNRDVEAADFDESELDELHVQTPTEIPDQDRYSVGSVSDDEDEKQGNGTANGNGKKKAGEKS